MARDSAHLRDNLVPNFLRRMVLFYQEQAVAPYTIRIYSFITQSHATPLPLFLLVIWSITLVTKHCLHNHVPLPMKAAKKRLYGLLGTLIPQMMSIFQYPWN